MQQCNSRSYRLVAPAYGRHRYHPAKGSFVRFPSGASLNATMLFTPLPSELGQNLSFSGVDYALTNVFFQLLKNFVRGLRMGSQTKGTPYWTRCPLLAKNSPPDCFLNAVTPANLSDAGVGESTGKPNKRDTGLVSFRTRTTSWATSTAFARLHEKQSSIVFLSLRPLCSFASLSRRRLVGSRRTTRGKANKRDTELVSLLFGSPSWTRTTSGARSTAFARYLLKTVPRTVFLTQ